MEFDIYVKGPLVVSLFLNPMKTSSRYIYHKPYLT